MPPPDLREKCLCRPQQWGLLNSSPFPQQDHGTNDVTPHAWTIAPKIFLLLPNFRKFDVLCFPSPASGGLSRKRVRWSRAIELRDKYSALLWGKIRSLFPEGDLRTNSREQVKTLWNAITKLFQKIKGKILLLCLHSWYTFREEHS